MASRWRHYWLPKNRYMYNIHVLYMDMDIHVHRMGVVYNSTDCPYTWEKNIGRFNANSALFFRGGIVVVCYIHMYFIVHELV